MRYKRLAIDWPRPRWTRAEGIDSCNSICVRIHPRTLYVAAEAPGCRRCRLLSAVQCAHKGISDPNRTRLQSGDTAPRAGSFVPASDLASASIFVAASAFVGLRDRECRWRNFEAFYSTPRPGRAADTRVSRSQTRPSHGCVSIRLYRGFVPLASLNSAQG